MAGTTSQERIHDAGISPQKRLLLGWILAHFMSGEPEALGLLALMLYCESRRDARRDATGAYVPLSDQDVARWSQPLIDEAEALLHAAETANRTGRFQLEAAIQSAHARRSMTRDTDWEAIALLYEGLVGLAPTIGSLLGRAAAVAQARDAATAWALLEELPREQVRSYQPYWALAAHLLSRLGRLREASDAYARAIGLCDDPAMRDFLMRKAARVNAKQRVAAAPSEARNGNQRLVGATQGGVDQRQMPVRERK